MTLTIACYKTEPADSDNEGLKNSMYLVCYHTYADGKMAPNNPAAGDLNGYPKRNSINK